jgi:hypothetical protein
MLLPTQLYIAKRALKQCNGQRIRQIEVLASWNRQVRHDPWEWKASRIVALRYNCQQCQDSVPRLSEQRASRAEHRERQRQETRLRATNDRGSFRNRCTNETVSGHKSEEEVNRSLSDLHAEPCRSPFQNLNPEIGEIPSFAPALPRSHE